MVRPARSSVLIGLARLSVLALAAAPNDSDVCSSCAHARFQRVGIAALFLDDDDNERGASWSGTPSVRPGRTAKSQTCSGDLGSDGTRIDNGVSGGVGGDVNKEVAPVVDSGGGCDMESGVGEVCGQVPPLTAMQTPRCGGLDGKDGLREDNLRGLTCGQSPSLTRGQSPSL